MGARKRKIGELLLENKLITKDILNEALAYQGKFGGGITQFLIAYGYITEEDLAKCISQQFGVPYLSLRAYNISGEVIDMVPMNIAEKYWLIPVDRMKNILTVVMSDPFDAEAIEEVEKVTGSSVQPFVGILSDIIQAIEHYYNIAIKDDRLKTQKMAPLFIDTRAYSGLERRKSVRLDVKTDIHFPDQELYKRSKTKNISLHGLLFESDNVLPLGAYITLEVDLPKEFNPYPIAAIVQVVRIIPLKNNRFDIGVKLIKMPKDDAETITRYAREQQG